MKRKTDDTTLLKPVKRRNVKDQVFEQLKDQILKRVWLPGTKIPSENVLVEELGVSRVSIRGAVQMLASLGLVETHQGGGTFVREYTGEIFLNPLFPMLALEATDVFHVLEYRKIIETGTVAVVVEKADEAAIAVLERAYEKMVTESTDVHRFASADLEFHLELAKATGNPIIIKINDFIKTLLGVSMDDIVFNLGVVDGLHYHRKILDAIKARDAELAQSLMKDHIFRTIDRLKKEGKK
jgi:GntR family transcriptional repressor for pyruvate dehydrogenase complex